MLQKANVPSGIIAVHVTKEYGRAAISDYKETRGITTRLAEKTAAVTAVDGYLLFYRVSTEDVIGRLIKAGQVTPGVTVLLPGQRFFYTGDKPKTDDVADLADPFLSWLAGDR